MKDARPTASEIGRRMAAKDHITIAFIILKHRDDAGPTPAKMTFRNFVQRKYTDLFAEARSMLQGHDYPGDAASVEVVLENYLMGGYVIIDEMWAITKKAA